MKEILDALWAQHPLRGNQFVFLEYIYRDAFKAQVEAALGKDTPVEWRGDGSCVVAGVILLLRD